jgi:hypothetical protein
MPRTLVVTEGVQEQTTAEEISYTVDVSNYPGSGDPSGVAVTVFEVGTGTNVTSTVMPTNSPSVAGNIITLSTLKTLTRDKIYHVRVKFTRSGNIFQPHFEVRCPY